MPTSRVQLIRPIHPKGANSTPRSMPSAHAIGIRLSRVIFSIRTALTAPCKMASLLSTTTMNASSGPRPSSNCPFRPQIRPQTRSTLSELYVYQEGARSSTAYQRVNLNDHRHWHQKTSPVSVTLGSRFGTVTGKPGRMPRTNATRTVHDNKLVVLTN